MKAASWLGVFSFAVLGLTSSSTLAQQPHVQNARMETRAVSGGFEAAFQGIVSAQSAPAWIGYAVPVIKGERQNCCWNNDVRGCFLEPRTGNPTVVVVNGNPTVNLEGPTHLIVLFRVENRQVGKVRSFTPECELDAGGLPFVWLTGVSAPESIKVLLAIAKDTAGATREQLRKADSALSAIALHADPAADTALDELLAPNQPEQVRRQAIFWIANARGQHGFQVVSKVVREDPSDKIREHAVFALTQNKDPQALEVVVSVARNDKSVRVRGQALFWLAQRAGQKVAESAINDAIANDPETEVKKKAVFALTQMPAGEGIPLLIQVARTNRNPEVRKQAMFWLGQSKDERALRYFEEVLK
ncbi:MAG TPA: HEAT repeat domain-containing protein [Bryobacteraceae bacterium]|nr:HEAT repeat domain-containing protein [Bryobacteraceae bacterium]